ncbi:MAG: bifunctional [glutamate--ammonia ligase]-adenylyl-L-tyrosine phosphorylase/[glutamate--ammonia-ligase] adenylyltransferase, partial [Pseudomonadota bacterium]
HILLEKFLGFIEKILKLRVYIKLLHQYPAALMQLIDLFSKSDYVAEIITRYPFLLDEFANAKNLFAPYSEAKLDDELRQSLLAIPEDDLANQMECLRDFKLVQLLRVVAADLAATLPLMKVSDHLTFTATVIIRYAKAIAWESLTSEVGYPLNENNERLSMQDFAIIAYGKLGGIELSYDSDLDLVFLHTDVHTGITTDSEKPITNSEFFVRLAQRIIHILSARTRRGVLYEVDTRLRPSGSAGLLVHSLSSFSIYQREKAWTWEQQALVRARLISGSKELEKDFWRLRAEIISRQRDTAKLKADVKLMREKMLSQLEKIPEGKFDIKQSMGGINTIEFMVQFFALNYGHKYMSLYEYTDNIRILEAVAKEKLLPERDAEYLSKVYRTYRRVVHHSSVHKTSVVLDAQQFVQERQFVELMWKQLFEVI